jgi:hypothetical protein
MGKKKHHCQKKSKKIYHDYCFWTSINESWEEGDYIYIYFLLPKNVFDHNLLFELTSQKVQHSTNTKRSLIKLAMFKTTCPKCVIEP